MRAADVRVPEVTRTEQSALRQSLDDRKQGQRLADACAMDPDQVAVRPRAARMTAPLAKSGAVLAALSLTPVEQAEHRRFEECRGRTVGA